MEPDTPQRKTYPRSNTETGGEPVDKETMQECMSRSLEQLSAAFRASARRWELIVYPSLLAFIVLSVYGFYLIYSLTRDVRNVSDYMASITTNMAVVAGHMERVSLDMALVAGDVQHVSDTMQVTASSLDEISHSMRQMNVTMDQMRFHFAVMNQSVGRPMSFMNSFMPW